MKLVEGKAFEMANPGEVLDYLRKLKRQKITVSPEALFIFEEKERLFLAINDVGKIVLPLRRSFVHKLLRWFNFPLRQLGLLNAETVVSILNDYLVSIKSSVVNIKIENGEALTITSEKYTDLEDLYLLETFMNKGISAVTRDDFMMRIYSLKKKEIDVFANDKFQFGFNIINSETGFSALSVYYYAFRLVCSNGLVARKNAGASRFHYGYGKEELKEFVVEKINQTVVEKEEIIIALKKSKDKTVKEIKSNVADRIAAIAGRKSANKILEGIDDDSKVYELINKITNFSQNLSSWKRFELEKLAGKIILN